MFSLKVYALGSALVTAGLVGKYFAQHEQYYTTVVALMNSKAANLVEEPLVVARYLNSS